MNKNSSTRFLFVLPALAFLAFVIAFADSGTLAQNTNSSNTGEANTAEENANGATRGARARGRRGRNRNRASVDPSEAPADEMRGAPEGMMQDTDTGASSPGEAADLSGTYTGRMRMSGGHEMSGEGTLTITGNQFTLTAEGMSHTGRIIAITTRGYTGATLWFNDMSDPSTNTPIAFAVRARKGRNNLTLTPVPGARNRFQFNGRAG